ncbi:diaminobutyrate acetyltransferase [Gordonia alkaliphila]|uniref:diaminobutyrate acetyltransferase n=1 Tax=Gordonia alkaliphila TaxID=1053547 RepID=UPI001FF304A3|nr:diaminobutyrate acetyltransferase [Gordonia alkaliphila]MCK0440304.1 diaminobutyrate acetyltransferase [Gordonia alkaliphila]
MNPDIPKSRQHRDSEVKFRKPVVDDGIRLWEIARDTHVLDVNSSYAYVLWCHDFAETSIVAESAGNPVGFVTGYRRPDQPNVLMVWQVAVDADQRGAGIAARMLTDLFTRAQTAGVTCLHTTISPDNVGSQRLFAAAAEQLGLDIRSESLFDADVFPDAHQPEDLYILSRG